MYVYFTKPNKRTAKAYKAWMYFLKTYGYEPDSMFFGWNGLSCRWEWMADYPDKAPIWDATPGDGTGIRSISAKELSSYEM